MSRNIKTIKIVNFQSHEYSIIDLDRGVNVIVGKTDSGKSAIIRALRWLFFNEPRGTDFIRNGEDEVKVEILYDDGYIVRRIRNKKVNGYEIEINSEVETYYGIGTDVPQEVINITGVKKIKFSESNDPVMINFQNQHDGAFMLNDSPAQKAKSIGYISKVNVIDEAIRKANQYEQSSKQVKRQLDEQLQNNIDELKKYDTLDDEINKLDILKSKLNELKSKSSHLDNLSNIRNNYFEINNSIFLGLNYIAKFNNFDNLIKIFQNLNKKYDGINALENKLLQFRNNNASIEECNTLLVKLKNLDNYRRLLIEVEIKINKLQTLNKIYSEILRINNIIYETNLNIKQTESIDQIRLLVNKLSNNLNVISSLTNLNERLFNANEQFKCLDEYIIKLDIKNAIDIYNKIYDMRSLHELLTKLNSNYKAYIREFSAVNNDYDIINNQFKYLIEQYINLISEAKKCPLCGSLMDDEHLNSIKKEYGYEI